jgi:DNA-binding transcriptional regulator YdaS (Cro superfamily)
MDELISYLKANTVSQVNFAARIGISQSALSKMCSGAITPRLQTALAIERETGGAVSVSTWVGKAKLSANIVPKEANDHPSKVHDMDAA